jgi:hypothetical protein
MMPIGPLSSMTLWLPGTIGILADLEMLPLDIDYEAGTLARAMGDIMEVVPHGGNLIHSMQTPQGIWVEPCISIDIRNTPWWAKLSTRPCADTTVIPTPDDGVLQGVPDPYKPYVHIGPFETEESFRSFIGSNPHMGMPGTSSDLDAWWFKRCFLMEQRRLKALSLPQPEWMNTLSLPPTHTDTKTRVAHP